MSKHTAGPWYVERVGELNIYVRSSSEHGARVVKIEILTKPTEEEDLANANLVAAAPELLEALELAIAPLELYKAYGWPDRNGVIIKAKAAIAKARGEA